MTSAAADDPGATHTLTGVLRALAAGGVDFVVCGGVACILHGVNRTTADVDLAVRLEDSNLRRFVDVVRRLGFQPRIPEPLEALLDARKRREWVEAKHATDYTLVSAHHPIQVDVFLQYPIIYDDLKARANAMTGTDVMIHVSSREDLIAAKRLAGREQDDRDIRDLERIIDDEPRRTTTD
jgi:predicted nucleotidyltransferase